MNLSSMSVFGEVNHLTLKYLDSTELVEGNRYTCLAYVANTNSGVTKKETGFYTFYLKSCDNAILTAHLFNIKNFIERGFSVKMLMHKPVKVTFVAQIFRGNWSLIIEEIEQYDGNFDRSQFLGRLKVDTDVLRQRISNTGVTIQLDAWESASFSEIADGNAGAFVVLANTVMDHLKNYSGLWGVDEDALVEVALYVLKALFAYYTKLTSFAVVPSNALLSIIDNIKCEASGVKNIDVIVDACCAVIGLSEPQHLYAILVNRVISEALTDLKLIYLYKSMPMGANTYYEGIKIVKY